MNINHCKVCGKLIDPRSKTCRRHMRAAGTKARAWMLTDKAIREMDGVTDERPVVTVPLWLIADR